MTLAEVMVELALRRQARLFFQPSLLAPSAPPLAWDDEHADVTRFRLEPEPDRPVLGLPTRGVISSPFGNRRHPIHHDVRMHAGVDIAAPAGTPVWATGSGRVIAAGSAGGYGLRVLIDHGEGRQTIYAHLRAVTVHLGDQVDAGESIGEVGSTGISTGPHVHYETRVHGHPVQPVM